METCDWRSGRTVKESLKKNYHHFNIFQVMRLLQADMKKNTKEQQSSGDNFEDDASHEADAINGAVRISSEPGYDFAPSEVMNLVYNQDPAMATPMSISSFSIAGRSGPLPQPHKEYLENGNSTIADFLDMFNHRLNVLRFLIKKKANAGLEEGSPEKFFSSVLVKNISGFGTAGLAKRWPLSSRELMLFSGLLASKRRSASTIKAILSYYLKADVKIHQFEQTCHEIHTDERTHIGKEKRNNSLGKSTVLGTRCYDRHNQIKIVCGPIDYSLFRKLLPSGQKYRQFKDLILLITDNALNCEIELVLLKKDIPVSLLSEIVNLGSDTSLPLKLENKKTMMLGRTAWLKYLNSGSDDEFKINYLIKPEA